MSNLERRVQKIEQQRIEFRGPTSTHVIQLKPGQTIEQAEAARTRETKPGDKVIYVQMVDLRPKMNP